VTEFVQGSYKLAVAVEARKQEVSSKLEEYSSYVLRVSSQSFAGGVCPEEFLVPRFESD
jgi:hypothetical protein